jgi:hypothetical protein
LNCFGLHTQTKITREALTMSASRVMLEDFDCKERRASAPRTLGRNRKAPLPGLNQTEGLFLLSFLLESFLLGSFLLGSFLLESILLQASY